MPVFHSVGASDPIEPSDVKQRVDDGLPNTLEEWIRRDGLIRFKIKLNGGNLPADLDRVDPHRPRRVARAAVARRARLEVSARLQRGLPERRLSAGVHAQGARGDARRASPASSTSSSRPRAI